MSTQIKEQQKRMMPSNGIAARIMAAMMAIVLAVPTCLAVNPKQSFAATNDSVSVAGVDFLQTTSTEVEILKAENLEDKSIFIDLSVTDADGNTTQLLKLHEYNQKAKPAGTDFEVAQIVTLGLNGKEVSDIFGKFGTDPKYKVSVYESFFGGTPLYEGAIYPIYAELISDTSTQHKLIGLRTASTDEVKAGKNVGLGEAYYEIPQSDEASGSSKELNTYSLVHTSNGCDVEFRGNAFVAKYIKNANAESGNSITGAIRYVDTDGNLVRIAPVEGVTVEGKEVYIDSAFNMDGKYYRVLSNLGGTTRTMTAEYPTITVRVIEVLGMSESAYSVTVFYIDENDDYLWEDTVDIKGYGYQYTLPEAFSMTRAGGVEYYKFAEVLTDTIPNGKTGVIATANNELTNPIMFDKTMDADSNFMMVNGKRAVSARFNSKDVDKALTVVEVDGQTNDVINTEVLEITREKSVSYQPELRAAALAGEHDVDYVSWSGNREISCTWDDIESGMDIDLLQYAYYVPEGYTPTEAYTVDVQYMNVANSNIMKTETVTIEADQSGYININGPERFIGDNGNSYVRLAGQERGFNHSYYTNARTYTIYYRDVNDVINANTVINRVQIIETTIEAPAATTIAAVATPGATITEVETGVTAGDGTAIIADDATPLANLNGEDTVTERTIADNANPLAAASAKESQDISPLAIGLGIGAVIVAAAFEMFIIARKRKQQTANTAKPTRR